MRLLRNSLHLLLGNGLPLLVALITIPLYIEAIGMARYGALAIGWLLLGYFGQADFGIGRALTQRIASAQQADSAQLQPVIWSAAFAALAISLASAVLVYVVAHYYFAGPFEIAQDLRGELLGAVWILAFANPIVALNGVAGGALMGLERFRRVAASNLVGNSAGQILPLVVASVWGPNLSWLIMAAAAGKLIGMAIGWAGLWRDVLQGAPIRLNVSEMHYVTSFGTWIAVSGIISPLMVYADRVAIGVALGAAAVAAYTIPFQIANRIQLLPIALVQALFPRLAAESAAGSIDQCRKFTIFVGQLYAPLVVALICLSAPLLRLWLGDGLDPRSPLVAVILLASFWVNAVANVPYAQLHARGLPRFTALLHLAELPIYAVMLAVLGTLFGLAGIACAFGLRCLLDAIALVYRSGIGLGGLVWALTLPAILVGLSIVAAVWGEGWLPALGSAITLSGVSLFVLLRQMPVEIRVGLARLPFARAVPGLVRPDTGG